MAYPTEYGPIQQRHIKGVPEYIHPCRQLTWHHPSVVEFGLPSPHKNQSYSLFLVTHEIHLQTAHFCTPEKNVCIALLNGKEVLLNPSEPDLPTRDFETFTRTDTKPFLFSSNYPPECFKTYDIFIPEGPHHSKRKFRMMARNSEQPGQEDLTIRFFQHNHDGRIEVAPAVNIGRIVRAEVGWKLENLSFH